RFNACIQNVLNELLPDLLATKPNITALVPGCGEDTIGIKALGIDLSETGLQAAIIKYRSEQKISEEMADYKLILVRIGKAYRKDWAQAIAKVVAPGGYLIAYMFPLRADDEQGPPYALSVEIYKELLSSEFEEVYIRDLKEDEAVSKDRKHLGGRKCHYGKRNRLSTEA
ncbi:S-adenosyl-L-methionine-dependent methyltransferase, partial [Chytridium lagenaria]